MNAASYRSFLLRQPRPFSVRVQQDGKTDTLDCAKPGHRWADTARTLESLGQVDRIDAIDEKGNLIRSVRPDDDEVTPAEDKPKPGDVAAAKMVPAAVIELWSKLLADAYRFANETAFAKVEGIAHAAITRADRSDRDARQLQRDLINTQVDNLNQQAELAEQVREAMETANAAGRGDIVESFLQSAMAAGGEAPAASNGAARPRNGRK